MKLLVLGGCGSIGRNIVRHCVENSLATTIIVADKTIPQIAQMCAADAAAFESELVTFVQADLTREAHVERAFGPFEAAAAGDSGGAAVINCAAETRNGQSDETYEQKCTQLSLACARRAASTRTRFVEFSTAFVYKSQCKKPAAEGAALGPWTAQAAAKARADAELLGMASAGTLDLVLLRPAFVYGPADATGLMPRVVCAAAYVQLGTKMKLLWDAKMRVSTVHMHDVVRAALGAATAAADALPSPPVFNLADAGHTDQGTVSAALGALFGIRTGFHGKLISNVARLKLSDVVDEANETHMAPWAALCREKGVGSTHLSPYIHKELLGHNHMFIDGSAIAQPAPAGLGFRYSAPAFDPQLLRAAVQQFIDQNVFPAVLTEGGAPAPVAGDDEEDEDEAFAEEAAAGGGAGAEEAKADPLGIHKAKRDSLLGPGGKKKPMI